MPDDEQERDDHFGWGVFVLGVAFSVPPVIALIQNHFDFHLQWGFAHFVEFYRATITPLIDMFQWPLRKALALLEVHWIIPQWFKDLHTLSFVLAGVFVRGWVRQMDRLKLRRMKMDVEYRREEIEERKAAGQYFQELEDELSQLEDRYRRQRQMASIGQPIRQTAIAFALGFSGLGLLAWLLSVWRLLESMGDVVVRMLTDTRRKSREDFVRRRYRESLKRDQEGVGYTAVMVFELFKVAGATAAAVAAFYLTNAIAPQLGL